MFPPKGTMTGRDEEMQEEKMDKARKRTNGMQVEGHSRLEEGVKEGG